MLATATSAALPCSRGDLDAPSYAHRVSSIATEPNVEKRSRQYARWALVVWTVAIWGSRVRNIVDDDTLGSAERFRSLLVAVVLIVLAVGAAYTMLRNPSWHIPVLSLLIAGGVFRFTIRGVQILLSSEWSVGFKVVHTVLWVVTIALSALAAWEAWKSRPA